tara:strand:- start:49 stop:747 length:699 start_codon:yes stop_codon:yes gene_type:complete
MVDVLGLADIPINVPSFGFGIGTGVVPILVAIFIIVLAGGIILFLWTDRRLYNKKIVLFENISGQGYQPVFNDRARTIKLGSGGEELLYLKKKKVYRTAYGRKMGKNTYWFCVGARDGYWYNVLLGDIDAQMGMLDVEPIDRDMRYMHVAIRKNIEERYNKPKFMEKYGTIMMSGIFLIVMIIGIWFLLDKIADISTSVAGSVKSATQVQEASRQILASLDNVCGGSGLVKA